MRKIRLSDTDIEFFDMEVSPTEFLFFTKHKDAFRCMWKEQGKPFWTRFIITFRSYTVKQGVIKQMNFDSPKLNDLLDQGFINIHDQFLEGNATSARSFVDDIARLAQNHDKFPNLDSKNFAKDPFYCRDTRELFRQFFGSPDQKTSYLKVYILSPVYLRFGGSVCRCLKRWMDAPPIELMDDSYWTPPAPDLDMKKRESNVIMCSNCLDECGTLYFQEKLCGKSDGPKFIDSWKKGDPRFTDRKNPLYNKLADPESDWRSNLTVEDFRDFIFYANNTYGEKCTDCLSLTHNCPIHNCPTNCCENQDKKKNKKKRKKKKKEKENETGATKTEDEIEKLVNHIEGTVPLEVMPENTVAGAKSPKKENGITENKKVTPKKEIFTKRAKISDDFKYGIMPYQEKSEQKRNMIGGFKVKKIEDERTGACEITVTVKTLKGERPKLPGYGKSEQQQRVNKYPLTVEVLKSRLDLPKKFEWYEGWNWCASVMNYEDEEKDCPKPTNFTLKVNGREEENIKKTMLKLLCYVIQRKNRCCPGWNMEDDDIVACILPDEIIDYEGTVISIIRGFRFEDRLSDEEKSTMQEPPEECIANPKKVMMTWQPAKARSILRATEERGRAELKELLLNVGSIVNRVDEIPDNCSPQKKRQLELKIHKQMEVLKARPPRKIDEGPMYKQMKQNPDTFELFIMGDGDQVEELEKIGMMAVDVAIDEKKFCEYCGRATKYCQCIDRPPKERDPSLPLCNCVNCMRDKCVKAVAGGFGDTVDTCNQEYVERTPAEIEADIWKERKLVQKVLTDADKRIAIKQMTDKADGIVPKKITQYKEKPQIIKIDRNASMETTINQIKQQTSIYRHDAKRTERGGRKVKYEKKSEAELALEHEKRLENIKELERERSALRRMVLEEKRKEEEEKMSDKLAITDGKDTGSEISNSKGKNLKRKLDIEKEPLEESKEKEKKEKEKIQIEIQLPVAENELPFKDKFRLNEQFVHENPHLLKRIVEALEKNEKYRSLNMHELLNKNTTSKTESVNNSLKTDNKVVKPGEKSLNSAEGSPKTDKVVTTGEKSLNSDEGLPKTNKVVTPAQKSLNNGEGLPKTDKVVRPGKNNGEELKKNNEKIKEQEKMSKSAEKTINEVKVEQTGVHKNGGQSASKEQTGVHKNGGQSASNEQTGVDKNGGQSASNDKEKINEAQQQDSKAGAKQDDDEYIELTIIEIRKTFDLSKDLGDMPEDIKKDLAKTLKEELRNKEALGKEGKNSSDQTVKQAIVQTIVAFEKPSHSVKRYDDDDDDDDDDFSVLEETAKTFQIFKKLGTPRKRTKQEEVAKQMEDSSSKATEECNGTVETCPSKAVEECHGTAEPCPSKAVEECHGTVETCQNKAVEECHGTVETCQNKAVEECHGAADILLTGEPKCPCQAKAKELMKEKLKNKQKQTTTLKKELSHRLNCPEQLSVREEKPSLTACRSNELSLDITEMIEEQLIDRFNIRRIVTMGKKITMNVTTQTNSDLEGVKPYGFKDKIMSSKPWTEARRKCVQEKDRDFEKYLKYIDYKPYQKSDIGIQAGDGKIMEDTDVSSGSDKENQDSGVEELKSASENERGTRNGSPENDSILSRLRKCAQCETPEPAPKTYMKCQKCKLEGISNARYYCGRECQVKDWSSRHKKEHKEKLIN